MALKLPSAMHGFRLLTCSDDDLFQIIDSALVVASLRCPQELKIHKDCILQRLFDPPKAYTATDSDGSEITDPHRGNCGIVSHVSSKQVLDDEVFKKNEKVDVNGSESTGAKKTIKIKLSVRKASKIPQNLGQESSGGAREDVKESQIPHNLGQESSCGSREEVKASKIPQNLGHESSSGARKDLLDQEILGEPDLNGAKKTQSPALSVNKNRDLLDNALLQQKVEASRRKLHEDYQRCQDVKNKKKTRLIDFHDAPIMPPADAKRAKRFHSSFC